MPARKNVLRPAALAAGGVAVALASVVAALWVTLPDPAPLDGVDAEVARLVLACLRVEPAERPRSRDLAAGL